MTPTPITTVYQLAHAGWAALIVMAFAYYGWPWAGVLVSACVGTVKAVVWDDVMEHAPLKANLRAWFYWQVGVMGALLLLVVRCLP